MWRRAVQDAFPEAGFREPVQPSDLTAAEFRLGRPLPAALRQLLLESDGVIGRTHVDTVWPLEEIVRQNLFFRSTVPSTPTETTGTASELVPLPNWHRP